MKKILGVITLLFATTDLTYAASATCWCETFLGSAKYSLSGIDLTGQANQSYTGLNPQDNRKYQAACKQRCSDVSAQADKQVLANAVCQLNPDRTGVVISSRATLGARDLGQTYVFGTFKSGQKLKCPSGVNVPPPINLTNVTWVSNSTNQPGETVDGLCKLETPYKTVPLGIFPNGTNAGIPGIVAEGFYWNDTLILRGNAANGGAAQPIPGAKTCGWQ